MDIVLYIYIYFSPLNIPQSLLTSNVDYRPRPRPRELPIPRRGSAREDPDCHLPPGQGTAWRGHWPEAQSLCARCCRETKQQAGGGAWGRWPLLPALLGLAGAFAACWGSWWGAGAQRPWASGEPGLQLTGHLRGRGRKGQEREGHSWTRKPLQQLSGEEAPAKATMAIGGSKHPKKQVEILSDD